MYWSMAVVNKKTAIRLCNFFVFIHLYRENYEVTWESLGIGGWADQLPRVNKILKLVSSPVSLCQTKWEKPQMIRIWYPSSRYVINMFVFWDMAIVCSSGTQTWCTRWRGWSPADPAWPGPALAYTPTGVSQRYVVHSHQISHYYWLLDFQIKCTV